MRDMPLYRMMDRYRTSVHRHHNSSYRFRYNTCSYPFHFLHIESVRQKGNSYCKEFPVEVRALPKTTIKITMPHFAGHCDFYGLARGFAQALHSFSLKTCHWHVFLTVESRAGLAITGRFEPYQSNQKNNNAPRCGAL